MNIIRALPLAILKSLELEDTAIAYTSPPNDRFTLEIVQFSKRGIELHILGERYDVYASFNTTTGEPVSVSDDNLSNWILHEIGFDINWIILAGRLPE